MERRVDVVAGLTVEDVVEIPDQLHVEPLRQLQVVRVVQIELVVIRRPSRTRLFGVATRVAGARRLSSRHHLAGLNEPLV